MSTTKVSAAMQDLTDDYAFSGTVSGAGKVVQVVSVFKGTSVTGTTVMPADDTTPQNTEGVEMFTLAITPTSASNILEVKATCHLENSGSGNLLQMALFQDSTAGALGSAAVWSDTADRMHSCVLNFKFVAGTASETTLKIRAGGGGAGTIRLNEHADATHHNGLLVSGMIITEIQA
jgi:hypothetical protein